MPKTRSHLARLAALLVLMAAPAGADDAPVARPLFDGETLDGWKATDFLNAGPVKVEDGAIVMAEGRPMTGITTTRDDLPRLDYELTYEARILDGDDFFAACTFPVGDDHLTFVNGGWGGNVTGLSSIDGADASENETNHYVKYEPMTWYRFRLRVGKGVIRAWVDDRKVVDLEHAGRELKTRIETRRSQPLGFATYRTAGALRAVEVRRLSEAEAAELAADRP